MNLTENELVIIELLLLEIAESIPKRKEATQEEYETIINLYNKIIEREV